MVGSSQNVASPSVSKPWVGTLEWIVFTERHCDQHVFVSGQRTDNKKQPMVEA
jgi:hypothetical protein